MVQLIAFGLYLFLAVMFMSVMGQERPAIVYDWGHFLTMTIVYWYPFALGFIAGRRGK